MKTNAASLSVLGVLVIAALLVISILKIQQAYAQVDATSSDAVATSSTSTTPVTTSTTTDTATTDTTTALTDASTKASDSIAPTEPALNMQCPAERYVPSTRPYTGLPELDYPFHDKTISVTTCGRICFNRQKINLSTVFAGQSVGIKQVSDEIWLVSFMDYDLGYFDHETCRLEPIGNPFGPKVLPMFWDAAEPQLKKLVRSRTGELALLIAALAESSQAVTNALSQAERMGSGPPLPQST